MTDTEMRELTAEATTKSEKIRILDRAGVEKSPIAAFLGITYQHVYNVLHRDRHKRGASMEVAPQSPPSPTVVHQLRMGSGGRVVLPRDFVEAEGLVDGASLVCRQEPDGLKIMSRAAATELLRQIARHRMPEEAALLDALIGDEDGTRSP